MKHLSAIPLAGFLLVLAIPQSASQQDYDVVTVEPLEWRSDANCPHATLVINGRKIDHAVKSEAFLERLDDDKSKLDIQLSGRECTSSVGKFYGDVECRKKNRVLTSTAQQNNLILSVDVGLWGNDDCTIFHKWEPDF